MRNDDLAIFNRLFQEACEKCFGHRIESPLSETDCRVLSNDILDKTGLVIGVKSIKNYSIYLYRPNEGKQENPSVPSLDTLARYVMGAPLTDEAKRKVHESHHPYWFDYRRKNLPPQSTKRAGHKRAIGFAIGFIIVAALVVAVFLYSDEKVATNYQSDFNNASDSLDAEGWRLLNKESHYWDLRRQKPGYLTLYTMPGDNWPKGESTLPIKNLLVHEIDDDCFVTEIHMENFVPTDNWQQVGILLSEDSIFRDKVVRLSISYNDFFGGYAKAPEIILQGVAAENENAGKPEEIIHETLFTLEAESRPLVEQNLQRSSLRIEKRNNLFRFLYSTGATESFAFREVGSRTLSIKPKYVGIFAMKGLSETGSVIPVYIDSFSLRALNCSE